VIRYSPPKNRNANFGKRARAIHRHAQRQRRAAPGLDHADGTLDAADEEVSRVLQIRMIMQTSAPIAGSSGAA
jgi:hypothetical protein